MEKMTEMVKPGTDIAGFYDAIAPWYDSMTSFRTRFVQERPFLHLLVERFKIRSAIDAGSGTGFHSMLLAQLGVEVTAIDVSEQMLDALGRHAQHLGLSVRRVRSSFQELRSNIKGEVDAVFSMGNALAHMLTDNELKQSLKQFSSVLRPGGILFIQNLNYDRIMLKKERVQSVKEAEDTTFVRFYDYEGDLLRFNILRIWHGANGVTQDLHSTLLRPLLRDQMIGAVQATGFRSIRTYGSIALEDFQSEQSKDLVVLAEKPE